MTRGSLDAILDSFYRSPNHDGVDGSDGGPLLVIQAEKVGQQYFGRNGPASSKSPPTANELGSDNRTAKHAFVESLNGPVAGNNTPRVIRMNVVVERQSSITVPSIVEAVL